MIKWRKKLDVKRHLTHDDLSHDPKRISEISAKFTAEIRNVLGSEINDDIELFYIVEAFEDLAEGAGDDPKGAVDDFNGILRDLYDWADQARVWVG